MMSKLIKIEPRIRSSRWRLIPASLRLRLMGLVIFALLPVVVVLVSASSQRRNQAVEEVRQNTLMLARLAATNQQQLISGARDILITLAQLPAIKNNDRQACLFFLTNVLMQHPLYANFGAASKNGEIFCMTLPQRVPINIAEKSFFLEAMRKLDFATSEYQINPINSQAIITLAYPILDSNGSPQGIVFAELDLRWLYQFESAVALPSGAHLRVIDQQGTTLALYPRGEEEIGKLMPETEIVHTIIAQREGWFEGSDVKGITRFYAFTPLYAASGPEIYMIVDLPAEVILAEPTRNLILNLSALATGALLALIAAWFGSSWLILKPVNDLLSATRKLSAGDLSARSQGTHDEGELGELARAFNEMASALQQREAEQLQDQAQIRKQTSRAEALARIANRLNAHLELETVLSAICEEVCEVMNVPAISILLDEQGKNEYEYFYSSPKFHPDSHQYLRCLPLQRMDVQVSQGEPKIFSSLDYGSYFSPESEIDPQHQIHEVIAAGMVHEGKLIGYLNLFSYKINDIGEDELRLLKGIADEAALAITNARLYQALQSEERARASLLSSLISAQEDERMRIARELHDETSQSLTALLVEFDVLRMATQSHPDRVEGYLRDLKNITEEMLNNIHRLITDLRPALLDDLGLAPAITWYGDTRLSACGIEFDFDCDILPVRLPRSIETALFRIVQEAITNVIRHSHASMVNIRLTQQAHHLTLDISDNGCGFDVAILQSPDPQRGFGLRGMLERATILGGSFELQTSPNHGTHITVTLPLSSYAVAHE